MSGGGTCFRILLALVVWNAILLSFQSAVAEPSGITTPQGIFSLRVTHQAASHSQERWLGNAEKRFFELTGFESQDYPPIMVVLHSHESPGEGLPSLRVDSLEGGLPRIQVDLLNQDAPRSGTLGERLLATAMLLREYYGEKAPQVGSSIPVVSSWLSHGLATLCLDSSTQKTLRASYLNGEAPPGIEAFFAERPPDDSNQLLENNYNARAACLLQAGLKGEGAALFRKWIRPDSSAEHHDSISSSSNCPSGWPMQRIERDWLLLMAISSRDEKSVTDELTSSESLRRYDAITKAISIDAASFEKLRMERGWEFTSQGICSRLSALRLQANLLIIPLIDSIADLLQSGKKFSGKKLQERLASLTALRKETLGRSQAIDAYLDWYEAAKVPVRSGLFDEFLKSFESPVRKGPVGRYLDAVESRGW